MSQDTSNFSDTERIEQSYFPNFQTHISPVSAEERRAGLSDLAQPQMPTQHNSNQQLCMA
jgi:hypothetical protein